MVAYDTSVRSKDRTTNSTLTEATQARINRQIGSAFLDIDKEMDWNGGYVLDQVIIRRQQDGWQAIVKAHRNGGNFVAYAGGSTYAEALELLGEFSSRGCLTWLKDKYPPKKSWFRK